MEKYGFVYIWYDKKYPRFYVGAHWGTEDDGYICSSNWMRNAYKRRPNDFKRRILSKIYTSKKETFIEEEKWLSLIKDNKLGTKYYNRQKCALVGNGEPWNKGKFGYSLHSDEYKERLRKEKLGNPGTFGKILPMLGKKHSEETKKKMSVAAKRNRAKPPQPNKEARARGDVKRKAMWSDPIKKAEMVEKMRITRKKNQGILNG